MLYIPFSYRSDIESSYTFGADPEVFLHDNMQVISAIDKIGGTKTNPRLLPSGIALQEDNVLAEFNIPPVNNLEAWCRYVKLGLFEVREQARYSKLNIRISSFEVLEENQFLDERAVIAGCEPDFNIYTQAINPKPALENTKARSAGGHIHFGYDTSHIKTSAVIQWADCLLGLWNTMYEPFGKRRSLYGKAGCFRPKPYGVEYRTISNFWLQSDQFIEDAYLRSRRVMALATKIGRPENVDIHMQPIEKIINDPNTPFSRIEDKINYIEERVNEILA